MLSIRTFRLVSVALAMTLATLACSSQRSATRAPSDSALPATATAANCAPLDTEGFNKTAAGTNDPDGEKDQWRLALGDNPDYLTATSATNLIKPDIGIPPMIGVVRGPPPNASRSRPPSSTSFRRLVSRRRRSTPAA